MRLFITGFFFALGSFAQPTGRIEDLNWIVGHWAGAIGKAQTEEHWIAPAGGAMLGVSRTIAGGRMVAFEFLRIEARPEGIFYVAQPQGRPPVEFKLTRQEAKLAVFENPKHDHPKMIVYESTAPGALVATIEGDEGGKHKKMSFAMKRVR
jgi:hypothetical protein